MIAERLLVLLLLALAVLAVWGGLRLWRARRMRTLAGEVLFGALVPPGRPAIVAFSTASCAECRTRQAPALRRLADRLHDAVTVRSLNAAEHPELVDRLGILTVPATVVLDARGAVRHLNLGFADDERLAAQLRDIDHAPRLPRARATG